VSRPPVSDDDPDAPTPLGDALRSVGNELGLPEPDLVASLVDHWPDVVGRAVAEHARPRSLRDGVLTVAVDAPPWATQLRYLEHDIRARLRDISGRDSVHAVRIVVEAPR
jgi:predicted nucleic acid-binding Zn ribbon protein